MSSWTQLSASLSGPHTTTLSALLTCTFNTAGRALKVIKFLHSPLKNLHWTKSALLALTFPTVWRSVFLLSDWQRALQLSSIRFRAVSTIRLIESVFCFENKAFPNIWLTESFFYSDTGSNTVHLWDASIHHYHPSHWYIALLSSSCSPSGIHTLAVCLNISNTFFSSFEHFWPIHPVSTAMARDNFSHHSFP